MKLVKEEGGGGGGLEWGGGPAWNPPCRCLVVKPVKNRKRRQRIKEKINRQTVCSNADLPLHFDCQKKYRI